MARRVVITGIGTVTPVGLDKDTFWNNLIAGNSGICELQGYKVGHWADYDMPVKIGGQIKDFDPANFFSDRKELRAVQKDMDKVSQFAVCATKLALKDANADLVTYQEAGVSADRIATFVGTGIGGIMTTCDDALTLHNRGLKSIGLRSIIRLMPNAASGFIGIQNGFQGRAKSDSTACASGLDSVFDAYWYIKNGLADVMLTGGTEACLNPLSVSSFYNMTALSRRDCAPEEASCPFDAKRDGFVMGEGAVVFTMEELEVAKKRGATIYAELVGVGASCDAYHITAPTEDGSGGARAIEMALDSAGLKDNREAIDYIHAHGTSTPLNDARETAAIKRAFGDTHARKLCISSTKSMTGHLIGAAGTAGLAVSALAIQNSKVPPTINYKDVDDACDLDYVPNVARDLEVNYSLVQALGFGGHNTAAIVKKYEG